MLQKILKIHIKIITFIQAFIPMSLLLLKVPSSHRSVFILRQKASPSFVIALIRFSSLSWLLASMAVSSYVIYVFRLLLYHPHYFLVLSEIFFLSICWKGLGRVCHWSYAISNGNTSGQFTFLRIDAVWSQHKFLIKLMLLWSSPCLQCKVISYVCFTLSKTFS